MSHPWSDRTVPDRLDALRAGDLPVHTGRTLAYVYDSGRPDLDRVAREAVAAFAATNGLDPTAFPSVAAMENDLVGFALDLLDAPASAVGTVTSGGTESVLLAVQAARDARPDLGRDGRRPNLVVPDTVHAAFHKAAHYFGLENRVVPTGPDFRADPAATALACDDATVLVVASTPSYAHGVNDPVAELAALAAERGIRCHVDACIGGWVLPFAPGLGRRVTPPTFLAAGVTSISVDLHKYGYAPKGVALLLHRDAAVRRPQLFASADWPGYTMLNATMQSTRSGGPVAGAWAVLETVGGAGYERLAEEAFRATDAVAAAVEAVPELHLLARPDSTLVAFGTDETCDPFTVVDELTERGWHLQPQLRFGGRPASVHASVSAGTLPHVDAFAEALRESVAAAVAAGPVVVDPELAAFVSALDPATLDDAAFDDLLAFAGLAPSGDGTLALPTRRAEINALLDLASPRLREAVLLAFLDRLSRPNR